MLLPVRLRTRGCVMDEQIGVRVAECLHRARWRADARAVGEIAPGASYLQLFFYIVVSILGAEAKGAPGKRVRQPRVLPALAN